MVICSSCGSENPAAKRFCGDCGASLERRCPGCGAVVEAGRRFCGDCGASLALEAGPAGAPARTAATAPASHLEGRTAERRLVSVLFADLVGFTSIAERLDPEDARQLLSRYADVAAEVVRAHGGTVEKFIGDAVMAVWGAPVAHEDDAERAVRAGLEIVDAVPALGPALRARAGVVTGEAAVTVGAVDQALVAGDIVNTAARLQALAAPGAVLVGEATARAAGRAVAFEDAGELEVRGRQERVRALRAARVVGRAAVGSGALEPPFVGRVEELRLLKDLFAATGRDRRSHLVAIEGPTGIGKSRLARELSRYVDGLVGEVRWHEGRCLGHGEGVTFSALAEMVRARCGLLESDDEATTRAKVALAVERTVLASDEQAWVQAAILTLLGFGEAGASSERLSAAWRTFFERMAADATVVLVFEDYHFADRGLVELVEQLLDWGRTLPILVVTLSRPEARDGGEGARRRRHGYTEIHLEPLGPEAMRALLDGLVPGLPEPAMRSIVGRAEGIPLYAVETIRMLLDQGRLAADEGCCRVVDDLGEVAIPETLVELVASRLDALDPAERALLQDASVLGQTFTIDALAGVAGLDAAILESRLRPLERRDLVAFVDEPSGAERGRYAFVQALIREVAYSTLSKRERARLHLAAAGFFESRGGEELAAALAGQFVAAWRSLSGPEADALVDRTRDALRRAAAHAADLGAHAQALDLLTQALALPAGPAERADLLEAAGRAASAALHHEEAEALLRLAIEVRRSLGDRSSAARVTAVAAGAILEPYHNIPALALLEAEAPAYADLQDDPGVAALRGQLARAYFLTDQPRRALEVADDVLETAERLGLLPILVDTLVTKGSALAEVGRRVEGTALLRAGLGLAVEHDLRKAAFRARQNLGAYVAEDDPPAALGFWRENVAEGRRLGILDPTLGCIVASAELETGGWDDAEATARAALELELEPTDRANPVSLLAQIASWRGEPADALVAECEVLVGTSREASDIAGLAFVRGWRALAEGRLREAHDECMDAARTYSGFTRYALRLAAVASLWAADVPGARNDLAAAIEHRSLGRVFELIAATLEAGLAAMEGRAEAVSGFERARSGWLTLEQHSMAALVGIAMATLLDANEPAVSEAVAESRAFLLGLRAVPFIARLDEAMTRAPLSEPQEAVAAAG